MRRPGQVLSRLRAARARLGLRLREPLERRRRLRPPPARARSTSRSAGARSRRSAARATGCARRRTMRRTPIRLRVAAAFALAMAVVLAATGWFLYARLESHLATRARPGAPPARAGSGRARARSRRLARRRRGGPPDRAAARATPSSSTGAAGCSTRHRRSVRTVLTPDELAAARRGTTFANRPRTPGLDEPSRLLATPVERGGRDLVLVVGATRENRPETLASLRDELLIAGPVALLLATLAGYLLAGAALRPVERMRRRAAQISAETPGERLPVPETRDEIERLGETLNEMLGRLESALAARARLRRRRRPRAPHAARAAAHRARARAAACRVGRRAPRRGALLGRGGRPADPARGRSPADRPLRARASCPSGSSRCRRRELLASVARRFEWRAEEAGRSVQASQPTGSGVRGDRIRLEQALGNLVDNALRHGGGACGSRRCRSTASSSFTSPTRARAFRRSSSSTPSSASRDRTRRGQAAAQDSGWRSSATIADAHGGETHAANRERGGADVWLVLPAG